MTLPVHEFSSGATAYGSHYLGTWDRCMRKGFLSFLAPHPKGGRGLKQAFTPRPLRLGGIIHEGLAAYYASGPRDYQRRNIEYSVSMLEAAAANRRREWETEEKYQEELALGRSLLWDYHQFYKGDPDILVVEDEEGPLIEREWVVEIPGCPQPFTCRPDAVVEWKKYGNWVYCMEHKTSSVYGMRFIRTAILNSLQGSGECYTLSKKLPHLRIDGVLLNVALTDRSSKSKFQPFERETAARTQAQLEMFEHHIRARHEHIERLKTEYEALSTNCGDPWAAGAQVFVANGTSTGSCENTYNRPCELLDLCKGRGMEQVLAEGYVASRESQGDDDFGE